MRLHDALIATAGRAPQAVALTAAGRHVSYGELLRMAGSRAARLHDAGVKRGDRVIVLLENGIAAVASLYAVLLAGAVMVPVNPQTRAAKLAFLLADTGAVAVMLPHSRVAEVSALSRAACIEAEPETAVGCAESPPTVPLADLAGVRDTIDADLAALIYTSGSTAEPKGVMLTHLNMCSASASIIEYLGLRADDVILCGLPLSFDYGLYQVLMATRLGARVVLERGYSFPADVLRAMQQERVTVLPGVPTLFATLLANRLLPRADLGAIRLVTNTAAYLTVAMIERIRDAFPAATLFSMYGLTECKRVSFLSPQELDRRPRSVGRGMPNQECWLENEHGERLANGQRGELIVRGSHVMKGYWRRPVETALRLRPGPLPGESVLRTGDLFESDAEGFLYFVCRTDDIIKSRGEKVSPREVEEAVASLPGVAEVVVRGTPDDLLGEAVTAVIVREASAPGTELTEARVIRHCRALLENVRVPSRIEFVAALSRSANGKLLRRADG